MFKTGDKIVFSGCHYKDEPCCDCLGCGFAYEDETKYDGVITQCPYDSTGSFSVKTSHCTIRLRPTHMRLLRNTKNLRVQRMTS